MYIPFEDGEMFAVLSLPTGPSRDIGVIVAHGRGEQLTFHRNQITSRFARRLAAKGFHVIRFDYPGTGDSTGTSRGFALSISQSREIVRIAEELRQLGLKRFALVGYCVGGRSVLAASESIEGIEGVVLAVTPLMTPRAERAKQQPAGEPTVTRSNSGRFPRRSPLRRFAARLLARQRKLRGRFHGSVVDHKVRRGLRKLVEADRQGLMIYGAGDDYLAEARKLIGDPKVKNVRRNLVHLHDATPGVMHGFLSIRAQEAFIAIAAEWLSQFS